MRALFLLLAALVAGCASPRIQVEVQPPAAWWQGSAADLVRYSIGARGQSPEWSKPPSGFRHLLTCHPEPYPDLNTTLLIFTPKAPSPKDATALELLARFLASAAKIQPDIQVLERGAKTEMGGREARLAEFTAAGRSPDGKEFTSRTRIWVAAVGSGFAVVAAQQPAAPDPLCASQLEALLEGIVVGRPDDPPNNPR